MGAESGTTQAVRAWPGRAHVLRYQGQRVAAASPGSILLVGSTRGMNDAETAVEVWLLTFSPRPPPGAAAGD